MKKRIKDAVERASANPVLRKSAASLKPNQSIWGVLGVILFFILPEIIGFVWGGEIAEWAHHQMVIEPTAMVRWMYWLLEKIFEEGGSWVNLGIGIVLLGWLAWDFYKSDSSGSPMDSQES
jgi:hypothetical protein